MRLRLTDKEREILDILQSDAGTLGDAEQRVLGYVELDADFIGETFVETAKKRSAAGKPYTVADDVGI